MNLTTPARTGFLLAMGSAACSDPGGFEPVGERSDAVESTNRISVNRLAANRIAVNRISANRIAINRIAANRIAVNRIASNRIAANAIELDGAVVADLIDDEGGREFLSYVIGCALPAGQKVFASHSRTRFEFEGAIGLAPHWLERPLDRGDQRWVSACLLARVNRVGVSVQVSLRGPHSALGVAEDERAAYQLEEGAFWGNVFTPEGEPIDWNACRGRDQAAAEIGDLVNRDCTEPDPERPGFTQCGFKFAGDCGDFAEEPACRGFDEDGWYYERCSISASRFRHAQREVITTFVQPE